MKPKTYVTVVDGQTFHHIEAEGIKYVLCDSEKGRKAANKLYKKFK